MQSDFKVDRYYLRLFLGLRLNRLLIGRGVNLGLGRCFFLRNRMTIKATKAMNRIVSVIWFCI